MGEGQLMLDSRIPLDACLFEAFRSDFFFLIIVIIIDIICIIRHECASNS